MKTQDNETGFLADEEQQRVIDFIDGDALVLAPPGCGKTDVLTRRIVKAHTAYGIPYSDMLCLTFTNRASREMQQRVRQNITESTSGLFIGNLHRFCTRFLSENDLIHLDTSIIDEDDQAEIISDLGKLGKDSWRRSATTSKVLELANIMTKKEFGFPPGLVVFGNRRAPRFVPEIDRLARAYIDHKRTHDLIDYDDILNLAYKAMMRPDFKSLRMSDYPWIQVDEVQDLNPLQFAIVEKLASPAPRTIVYLGDERQAIFSFIGASLSGLQSLKERTEVFNFATNYRSPKYLVDFINQYASINLGVREDELPRAQNEDTSASGIILQQTADSYGGEQEALIAAQVRQLFYADPSQSIGILTRTNLKIEKLAKTLDAHRLEYLKLSNRDRFKMVDYKTVYSHMAVAANEHRGAEWSRILYQTGAVGKMSDARSLVTKLRNNGLSVTDLLRPDGSSYLKEFARCFDGLTLVFFDTETTGLDVFEDDVIQIAAVKITADGVVPGSEFEVFIQTDRPIPETLSNGQPNPMAVQHAAARKLPFAIAMKRFMEYVGEAPLAGHNAAYDVAILNNNLQRRCPGTECRPLKAWDTLKIARLVDPTLRSHRLEALIEHYGLPGVNSHNAADDVAATAALIGFLRPKMSPLLILQRDLLALPSVIKAAKRLQTRYGSYYEHTMQKLASPDVSPENSLVEEICWVYENMVADKFINPIPKFEYIAELFRKVMVDPESEPRFAQQLYNHVFEMRTFSESDLYHNGVVKESIHLMTVHKAKGLQFDTVIIHDTGDIPNGMDLRGGDEGLAEACRILYVAISRARRRLIICYNHECSPFIGEELQQRCHKFTPQQMERLLQLEDVFTKIDNP